MALNAIFSLSCPCCGAKVPVYSATSVLVVCDYCKSTLERVGENAVDTGKKSALLEDYSPLQINTSGTYHGTPFTIIGLLQIQYERGFWNEWYVLFANGKTGWLADFSGDQYVFTLPDKPLAKPIAFHQLNAGVTFVEHENTNYIASDVRKATRVKANARGELPFKLKENEDYLVADFRCLDKFMTLDYSENEKNPSVYTGKAVNLKNLRCQNLRTNDQILASAGQLKGKRTALKCPSCGGSLAWYPGIAQYIICPSCHSQIAMDEKAPKTINTHAIKLHSMREILAQQSTLKLGEQAQMNGLNWTVIGVMRIQETNAYDTFEYIKKRRQTVINERSFWYEYLLYSTGKNFLWLIETDEKEWSIAHSAEIWPQVNTNNAPLQSSNGRLRPKLYDYGGIVTYAAGAFYWRVEPNDVTYYQDYEYDEGKLCAERTREELNWSISKPVSGAELVQWFKRPELAKAVTTQYSAKDKGRGFAILFLFSIINLPAAFQALNRNDTAIAGVIFISFIVYYIILMPFRKKNDDDD